MKHLIYLTGFMGSGKTTFGKLLAQALHYEFTDLDHFIEKDQQARISELFEKSGEEGFRALEKRAIESTTHLTKHVIATGGGAPCFFDNMEVMNEHGTTIYLKLEPEALVKRLLPGMNHRPLIAGKSEQELLAFIESKLSERALFYEKSKLIVDCNGLTPEDTVRIVLTALG
jgi:shikimate kinase